MKRIIIGCPYKGLDSLLSALKGLAGKTATILDTDTIVALDSEFIFVGEKFEKLKITDFNASYIRYPYDLIPPHTQTFSRRENTEFLKTLAILFSDVAINDFSSGVITRNRIYSLQVAHRCGLDTPLSIAINHTTDGKFLFDQMHGNILSKALGNCYYAERLDNETEFIRGHVEAAEDGGEKAYIYPAHTIKNQNGINEYIENFRLLFLQNFIAGQEFRIYLIGRKFFIYERYADSRDDKSPNQLLATKMSLPDLVKNNLFALLKKFKLNYLCIDAIIETVSKKFVVIDINPFGSLPKYHIHPEPTDQLANYILNYKT